MWDGPHAPPDKPLPNHWLRFPSGCLIPGRKAIPTSIMRACPPVASGRLPPGRLSSWNASLQLSFLQVGKTIVKVAVHYAWCVICMRDAHSSWIKGRIANHQQTRVYTLFTICSFPVNKFSVHFQKKARIEFFLWWCVKLPPRGEIARIESNQPLYTMHSLLIFYIFTHNLCVSRIVYPPLYHSST